jgi:hypothetical protein
MVPNWLPELGTLVDMQTLYHLQLRQYKQLRFYIKEMEFHKFVLAMDVEAINSVGEDGETAATTKFLETLAIRDWMHLLEMSNTECQKGFS